MSGTFTATFKFQAQLWHSPQNNRGNPCFLLYFSYPRSDIIRIHGNHSGTGTLLSQHTRHLQSLQLSCFSCLLCKILLFRCFFYCFPPSLSSPFPFYPF